MVGMKRVPHGADTEPIVDVLEFRIKCKIPLKVISVDLRAFSLHSPRPHNVPIEIGHCGHSLNSYNNLNSSPSCCNPNAFYCRTHISVALCARILLAKWECAHEYSNATATHLTNENNILVDTHKRQVHIVHAQALAHRRAIKCH